MTKFTKEQAELHAFITGFLNDPMYDDKSATSMTAKVFRVALAALTAEPVYQACKEAGVWVDIDAQDVDSLRFNGEQVRKVYTAPPAPVVPEKPPEHLLPQGNSRDATYRRGATINGWMLCRAAMLQGAEPVQEWIPCSERMPENSDAVLVSQEGGIVFCAEFDGGEFYPDEFPNVPKQGREITHWMPLPAAPQQEVKP